MNREKVCSVVKGYLLKEKRVSFLICTFLCFVTVLLLTGNQLFQNVQTANELNAEALEGYYHVLYSGISEEEFQKIQTCPFVEEVGESLYIGRAEDGTYFRYINEGFRDLSASVADKNIKQTVKGRWAEKENEVVFTRNYMEAYNLKLGDTVRVDLNQTDDATGDVIYQMQGLALTVTGILDNEVGFADWKSGYVSEALAASVMNETPDALTALVKFDRQDKISEDMQRLNEYLGYDRERLETLTVRKNAMLAEVAGENGTLRKQNEFMNFAVWIVCVMVVYNIFYNRLFEKKRDFINLRKIGFQTRDLLKIVGTEFLIFIFIGFTAGMLAGVRINQWIGLKLMKMMVQTYDVEGLVSSGLSLHSVRITALMLGLVSIPCILTARHHLREMAPVGLMGRKRKNGRKQILAFGIVSMSAVLISLLAIQNNHSDEGISSVQTYIPGDFQLTKGSIFENMADAVVPSISDQALRQIGELPEIETVQSYEINYGRAVFLCEAESAFNPESGYYEMLSEQKQDIDGEMQCLYNLILVTTDNIKALAPDWDETCTGPVAVIEGELALALNLKKGDHFTIYDEDLIRNGSKDGCVNTDITVIDTSNIILSENHIGGNMIIVDSETAKLFPGELSRQVVNIWAKEGRETAAAEKVRRIAEKDGSSFHNARELMEEYTDSDDAQRMLKNFFILILALTGTLTYFNTVFVNLLNRRNSFVLMHRIGIRRSEICRIILKEGAVQGLLALTVTGAVQGILCISRKEIFPVIFAAVDAGVVITGILFPCAALYYIFHRMVYKK